MESCVFGREDFPPENQSVQKCNRLLLCTNLAIFYTQCCPKWFFRAFNSNFISLFFLIQILSKNSAKFIIQRLSEFSDILIFGTLLNSANLLNSELSKNSSILVFQSLIKFSVLQFRKLAKIPQEFLRASNSSIILVLLGFW